MYTYVCALLGNKAWVHKIQFLYSPLRPRTKTWLPLDINNNEKKRPLLVFYFFSLAAAINAELNGNEATEILCVCVLGQ